jgi:hypothetical protein
MIKNMKTVRLIVPTLVALSIVYASIALADSAVRRTGPVEGDAKRSYGAVNVIMYQTSW